MLHYLYRSLTNIGAPVIDRHLNKRLHRGKEDPIRFPERMGQPSLARPDGFVLWMHGASVGEANAMLGLINWLLDRFDIHILVTTGTLTSAKLMQRDLPMGAFHQYIPVDRQPWVQSFLDAWRPDCVLWTESDFWPNMLAELRQREIPAMLVQARMSAASARNWRYAPWMIKKILSTFGAILAQTPEDVTRIKSVGGQNVACLGNLKLAAPPLPVDMAHFDYLSDHIEDRPVWLAASTHPGDEELCARVHQKLLQQFPGLITIIVPRHPERGPDIAATLAKYGDVSLRSAKSLPRSIYVADTLGELGLFYRLSPITFMGKSILKGGGQNPFEAAQLGSMVMFGPKMTNFTSMCQDMLQAGAAVQVSDENALCDAVRLALADPQMTKTRGKAGQEWAAQQAHCLDRTGTWLGDVLAQLGAKVRSM